MFDGLAREIEALEVPPEGDAVASALVLRDRLEAKIAAALGLFEAAGGRPATAPPPPRRGCAPRPA